MNVVKIQKSSAEKFLYNGKTETLKGPDRYYYKLATEFEVNNRLIKS